MAPDEDEPTIDAAGAPRSQRTSVLPTASETGVLTTAAPILRSEELARTLVLMRLVLVTTGFGVATVWSTTRPYAGRLPTTLAFGGLFAVTAALLVLFRDPRRFDLRLVLVQGLWCVAAIGVAAWYTGPFSPVPMALCVGIYFFGLSESRFNAWSIYVAGATSYAVLCGLGMVSAVPLENAVLALANPEPVALTAVAATIQLLLALTFWLARRSRGETVAAFDRLERAARQIKKRDALLDEALGDLEHAMRPTAGRHTSTQVGEYAIRELIGRGAMGDVYRAEHPRFGQTAVKLLHPSVAEHATHVQRLLREAEITSSLASPHIVKVHEHGTAPDGSPYLAMELLSGHDLAWHLRTKKRLDRAATIELITEVARGLMVADAHDVVHRDIKPQNLFSVRAGGGRDESPGVERKGVWKILDFGVSRITSVAGSLTQGSIVGTPSYMAPEVAIGLDADHRADVFSLGAIAYRALTGRPAFTGADAIATLYAVVTTQPERPSAYASLPNDVDRVLALALTKDPTRRLPSASMLATALADAFRDRLDPRLRSDADALLAEYPWGSETAPPPRKSPTRGGTRLPAPTK